MQTDLCLSMWSFAPELQRGRMDIEAFVKTCRQLGVDAIEVVDHFWTMAGRPLRLLQDTGMRVCAYDAATDFVYADSFSRHQQVKAAYTAVEEAAQLGAPLVRLLAGRMKTGISREDALQMVSESLAMVAQYAHHLGITAVVEPSEDVVYSAEHLLFLVQQVGSDALRVNADLSTFLLMGLDPVCECGAVALYCRLVHLNDIRRARKRDRGYPYRSLTNRWYVATVLGEGEVRVQECLHALAQEGFSGPFSIEYLGTENVVEGVRRSVDRVRQMLQEVTHDG